MGAELVQKLSSNLDKLTWPTENKVTPLGSQTYDMGLDVADEYEGHPQILSKAMKTFLSGDSRPFAIAGFAYLFIIAAAEPDGSYAPEGLEHAMNLLEQAQEAEPDRPEINFIEALVYMHSGQFDNAQLVLEYLYEQAPNLYRISIAIATYNHLQGDLDEMEEWYKRAAEQADNVPKRLRLNSRLGDIFYRADELDKALDYYKQAVYFNKKNASLWHKISIIFWKQEEWEECARANRMALKLGKLPAAQKMAKALQEKLDAQEKGLFGRILGRP